MREELPDILTAGKISRAAGLSSTQAYRPTTCAPPSPNGRDAGRRRADGAGAAEKFAAFAAASPCMKN